jgi:lysylphosphatidylglycerol synthetase-like protein (DUF2156 family)
LDAEIKLQAQLCTPSFAGGITLSTSMTILQPRSHLASITSGIFFALVFVRAIPFDMAGSSLAALPYVTITWVFIFYCEFVRDSRSVQIDLQSNNIIVQFRSFRFAVKTHTYPLSQFESVVSYVTPARFPRNFVELVTHAGGESLFLVRFQPSSAAKSFWSTPREGEAPKAEALRKTLAEALKLQDKGFLGVRWPGAYVSPAPNPSIGAKSRAIL